MGGWSRYYWPGRELKLSGRYRPQQGGFFIAVMEDMFRTEEMAGVAGAAASPDAASDDFSGTNVQELGVDEADLVKNDGQYIYSVGGRELIILRAKPTLPSDGGDAPLVEDAVVSRTQLAPPSAYLAFAAEELLLSMDDSTVVVIAAVQQYSDADLGGGFSERTPIATLQLQTWSVATPSSPSLVNVATLEGTLMAARLIDRTVYLAVSATLHPPAEEGEPIAEAIMPRVRLAQGAPAVAVAPCESVSQSRAVPPQSVLVVASLSTSSGAMVDRVALATGTPYAKAAVYVSTGSLYVASYNRQFSCATARREGPCEDRSTTAIAAFTLSAAGEVAYRATAEVDGYMVSQWAMSEDRGYLRTATTVPASSRAPSRSRVDVLNATTLAAVGVLDGLAPTERIYAVRYTPGRAYVVTFRQIDPLFTIDLSDPAEPAVLGILKIPGFSNYLHPLGDGHLLGVGREGDMDGRPGGVKLAIFDVTDPEQPSEVATLELGGAASSTLVETDHRALFYDEPRSLLVLPVTERDGERWDDCDVSPYTFHGTKVWTLDPQSGFELQAALEHGPRRRMAWDDARFGGARSCVACEAATVRRAVRIDEVLYTISDAEVHATALDAGYAHLWYTPLHARTHIASEGGCSVGGAPIAWAAAAASHETIYCDVERDGEWCKPHDPVLSERECATLTTMDTFDNLLHKAASCCGYPTCESGCEIEYDECALWM